MTDTEWEDQVISRDLGELKVTETFEPHRIMVESPKRSEKIYIFKTNPQFIFYRILYESGKSIPELEGSYTTAKSALDALTHYLTNAKATREAKAQERWGDKEIPELKTKKRVSKKRVDNTNGDSFQTDSFS